MNISQKLTDSILIIAILIIGLWAMESRADTGISFTTISHHMGEKQEKNAPQYNDLNPGVGVFWSGKDFGADLVTYINSYGRNSVALTGSWEPLQSKYLQAGLFAGVASGYEHPYIGGSYIQVKLEKAALRLIIVPKVGETKNAATSVTLQGRVSF